MDPANERPPHDTHSRQASTSRTFEFITIGDPRESKDRVRRRKARVHAMTQATLNLRSQAEQRQENFRNMVPSEMGKRLRQRNLEAKENAHPKLLKSLSASCIDPFDSLAISSKKLQNLLRSGATLRAGEPIFTTKEDEPLKSLFSLFHCGLEDPVVSNGILLSLLFASNNFSLDTACLDHKGETIYWLNQKIRALDQTSIESAIGGILMLANIDYRLSNGSAVEMHMEALNQILTQSADHNVSLTDGIKRGIFWQDLDNALVNRGRRVFSHTTFPELHWARDPFANSSRYHLSPGFASKPELLFDELPRVLQDLHSFQLTREAMNTGNSNFAASLHSDNQQAWLESELFGLAMIAAENQEQITECICLAAYLVAYTLHTDVWGGCFIPPILSSRLIKLLRSTSVSCGWSRYPDLFLWLLYVGGVSAGSLEVRTGYLEMMREATIFEPIFHDLSKAWGDTLACLKQFIWSDSAFGVMYYNLFTELEKLRSLGSVVLTY